MKHLPAVVSIVCIALVACAAAQTFKVTGTVSNCFGGKADYLTGVDVVLLDSQESQELVALLDWIDHAPEPKVDDPKSVERYFSAYDRVGSMLVSSKRLAQTRTGAGGIFEMQLSNTVDDLLVITYAKSVDGPDRFAYKRIKRDNKSSVSVKLDISGGICGK